MITRDCPVKLTSEEIKMRGKQMAEAVRIHDLKKLEAKAAAARSKEEIDTLNLEIRRFGRCVDTGYESRLVECHEVPVWGESRMDIVRSDTGEIIDCRPFTDYEMQQRQITLVGGEETAKGKKSGKKSGAVDANDSAAVTPH